MKAAIVTYTCIKCARQIDEVVDSKVGRPLRLTKALCKECTREVLREHLRR